MTSYFLLEGCYRRDWIFNSPLSSVGLAFEDYLREHQYGAGTVHFYLAALAHFAYWITGKRTKLSDIDDRLCSRFLNVHLPHCLCPPPRQRQVANIRAALSHLLIVLEEQGFTIVQPATSALCKELAHFHQYLTSTCGLAPNTCVYAMKIAGAFIKESLAEEPIRLSHAGVEEIDRFILGYAKRWQPSSLRVVRTALKLYFRYRLLQGDMEAEILIGALPMIANWKGTSLPKALTEEQIRIFFGAFDLSAPSDIRDYAIARCLLDLGLRGHEVAQLRLDSIDWRQGVMTISGTKTRCTKQLPLPRQTGASIAAYIKSVRPASKSRSLFLRRRGPIEKPLTVAGVRNTMRRAFARCGLGKEFCNTHVFRHTFAIRLQRSGVSLKGIADVLRHSSLESTTTYAKTDVESLRTLALPWPGRRS
jgi:site-specific recombinase XerD